MLLKVVMIASMFATVHVSGDDYHQLSSNFMKQG